MPGWLESNLTVIWEFHKGASIIKPSPSKRKLLCVQRRPHRYRRHHGGQRKAKVGANAQTKKAKGAATMKINIKSLKDRKTFSIDVQPTFDAGDVKQVIERELNLPATAQRLVFGGKPLREGVALHELGVQKEATLHLVLRLKTYIEVRVRVMSGKTINLDSDPQAKLEDLVRSIDEVLGLGERPRVLCCDGTRLHGNATLAESGLKDHSTIHYILVPLPGLPSLFADEPDRARAYGLAGSLYARCGGIFGVAAFVDRCMDAWMAEPTLNANAAVATWHQRAQRCGFKFLVTQLMGYLTGGPQVYTGRSMEESHKHLGITEEQWGAFVGQLAEVCGGFPLQPDDVADIVAVIASMRPECVLEAGQRRPPNPGHPPPNGNSLYASLGGVYPIALFCDRLVDALLSDRTVQIPLDAQRTMASLKYLFTELTCALAGGPETQTAGGLGSTKLLLREQDFFKLLSSVGASADHLESPVLAAELARVLYDGMDLVLKEPIRWDQRRENLRVAHIGLSIQEQLDITGSAYPMRTAIERAAAATKVPLFYVPTRNGGFLLAMEAGADDAAREAAMQQVAALGFESIEGAPGCYQLPVLTDKDMALLIDVSGSMKGRRIEAAADNALSIYDKFTNDDDNVALIWFDHTYKLQFPLTPRFLVKRRLISNTRDAVAGGTAFYDALVRAVAMEPKSSNSYLVALTDGQDQHSKASIEDACQAIRHSKWRVFIIGLQVDAETRKVCERLAKAQDEGLYLHANDAGADLDAAFAAVAAQFVMPKVKSADAAASGGGARGV